MAQSSNFNVFLNTLNNASGNQDKSQTPTKQWGAVESLDAAGLAPVLKVLSESAYPVRVEELVTRTGLKVLTLALTLQKLTELQVVNHDEPKDTFELTKVGRQMLDVGKMIR